MDLYIVIAERYHEDRLVDYALLEAYDNEVEAELKVMKLYETKKSINTQYVIEHVTMKV